MYHRINLRFCTSAICCMKGNFVGKLIIFGIGNFVIGGMFLVSSRIDLHLCFQFSKIGSVNFLALGYNLLFTWNAYKLYRFNGWLVKEVSYLLPVPQCNWLQGAWGLKCKRIIVGLNCGEFPLPYFPYFIKEV